MFNETEKTKPMINIILSTISSFVLVRSNVLSDRVIDCSCLCLSTALLYSFSLFIPKSVSLYCCPCNNHYSS